jgi:hypothetical protein
MDKTERKLSSDPGEKNVGEKYGLDSFLPITLGQGKT